MTSQQKTGLAIGAVAAGIGAGLLIGNLRGRGTRRLEGRTALVIGGSQGLGLLLARRLASEGARLVICARHEDQLESARRDLERRGADVLAVVCDTGDQAQVKKMFETARQRFEAIDILVNSTGEIAPVPVKTTTVEDFERAMHGMFWGFLHPVLEALPDMKSGHAGRIVNVTSIGDKVRVPHLLPHACAEFAAAALSEGLETELAGTGIRVLTIVPGGMRTRSGLGAGLPVISRSAGRAARQIVDAIVHGETERDRSAPASLPASFRGLLPGLTPQILGLAARLLLPGGSSHRDRRRGLDPAVSSLVFQALIALVTLAARRSNQSRAT